MAAIYVALGQEDSALDWLERAYMERSVGLTSLNIEPMFRSLRSSPRFQNLLRRVRLPAELDP